MSAFDEGIRNHKASMPSHYNLSEQNSFLAGQAEGKSREMMAHISELQHNMWLEKDKEHERALALASPEQRKAYDKAKAVVYGVIAAIVIIAWGGYILVYYHLGFWVPVVMWLGYVVWMAATGKGKQAVRLIVSTVALAVASAIIYFLLDFFDPM